MVDLLTPRQTSLPSRPRLEEKTVVDQVNFTLTLCAPSTERRIGLLVYNNPVNLTDPLGLANGSHPRGGGDGGAAAAAADQALINSITPSPTPFDNTTLGSFSLFNIINGNLSAYLKSVLETLAVKGPIYVLGRTSCPEAAGVAGKAVGVAGIAATAAATANDAATIMINNAAQQQIQNSGPSDPTDVPIGDGLVMPDGSGGIY